VPVNNALDDIGRDDFSGRVLAITGAAGGIGRAIAGALHRRGADVLALDRVDAEEGLARLAAAGVADRVRYVQLDVTDPTAVHAALSGAGALDTVFANAGIVRSAPFLDVPLEDWRAHLDANLTGSFVVLQSAARLFVARRTPGHVVLTGSWVGAVPWPEISAYSVTKAGIEMLAKSAARELASHGVRVNVLSPGIVDSGMARRQMETAPQYARRVRTVIPLQRLQAPDEVAAAPAFLASPAARYFTGSTLLADGGASLFKFD